MNTNSGKPEFLKNKMHFKGFRSTNVSGKTQVEFLLYMAPQEIDKFLESNNQALLNTSTYIGSGLLDFDADFEEALRTP